MVNDENCGKTGNCCDGSDNYIIAIDGPAASGKGSVAKKLAQHFGISYLSTGCLYRGICIWFMDNNVSPDDQEQIEGSLKKMKMKITTCTDGGTGVTLSGVDVTHRLDDVITSRHVASYSSNPVVRARVRSLQTEISDDQSLVCEGRDITSVVYPCAKYKFYLTSSLSVRAKRRHAQEAKQGSTLTLEKVKQGINKRDIMDKTRPISPLVRVKDAIVVDSSRLNLEQTVDKIVKIIEKQRNKEARIESKKKDYVPKDFQKPFGATTFRRFLKLFVTVPYHIVYPTRYYNKKEVKQHKGKPVIFALQHRSGMDVATFFLAFPGFKLHFVGKESLFKPGTCLNWFLRSMNGFPLRPGKDIAVIRHSLNILKNGESLAIFPEGTRNLDSSQGIEIQSGTAMLAMKAGVPVIPVVSSRASRPCRLTKIKVGTTIYPKDYENRDEFSKALKSSLEGMLLNFEHIPKKKWWDKLPVPIARGIVLRDDKLLAIKRHKNGEDYFVFPGGHVDEGETAREAVVREVTEETSVKSVAMRSIYKYNWAGINVFYVCNYKSGEPQKTDAEEYTDKDKIALTGTYEPVWLDVKTLGEVDLRPNSVRDQLIKDIGKYSNRLTRPLIYIKD